MTDPGVPGPMPLPGAVLFACDRNAIRSPLAEGLMKARFGRRVYVQSAGVLPGSEIDGFAIAVAAEVGIDLAGHRCRSFAEMLDWGDALEQFDLIVALSPAAQRHAQEHTRTVAVDVVYWPVLDPSDLGVRRDDRLAAYRQTRDQITGRLADAFPDD